MDWLAGLSGMVRVQAEQLMVLRRRTLEMRQSGVIDRPTARRVVALLNKRIEYLADSSTMGDYIPCKRRDPTATEAIGRVTREEREHRRREQEAAKRRDEAMRRRGERRDGF